MTDIVAYNGVKEEAALVLAASLENSSLHPVAGALKDKVAEDKLLTCEKMQYHPGEGISAVCQQAKVCFGIAEYVHRSCRIPEAALQQAEKWRERVRHLYFWQQDVLCVLCLLLPKKYRKQVKIL